MTSLKYEIQTWAAAVDAYQTEDWDTSLDCFTKIASTSKILTNIGIIHGSLGEHDVAIEAFRTATSLDSYHGIAYHQAGVSNFMMGQYEAALKNFEDALRTLRGHEAINYEQIGLNYRLHAAAIVYNQGVTMIRLGNVDRGVQLLNDSLKLNSFDDCDLLARAVKARGEGFALFCLPTGTLYRPNQKMVANIRARDWMGKARLITPSQSKDEVDSFIVPRRAASSRPELAHPQSLLWNPRSSAARSRTLCSVG
ncbi:hypothetical protein FRB95_009646 [Tulasnella sp. JGI-2019a]|nr:hypothetical protein FRB95_009646 [Tulasnella sp. JGI-2019a]